MPSTPPPFTRVTTIKCAAQAEVLHQDHSSNIGI